MTRLEVRISRRMLPTRPLCWENLVNEDLEPPGIRNFLEAHWGEGEA